MENFPSFKDLISGNILNVSELNLKIKETLEREFKSEYIWIEGEVSNFRGNYSSGHWYMSLKDDRSQISAVCFKWANQHIKFVPEDGLEVICCGQVSVYEKNGTYQLNIRYIEPKGKGAQALALEQLKEKLNAEGLFDKERKRPIPFLSRRIGVVTSPTGAAIKDILKVVDRRFSNTEIVLSPTRVQGDSAPGEIVKALKLLFALKPDLIIIARGGGSREDLWVFNEESVARTISNSPVPTISAIGHEIDITISDLVSDLRAATPSMAAELAVREKAELSRELATFQRRINNSLINKINYLAKEVEQLQSRIFWNIKSKYESNLAELSVMSGKLDSLSPLKVLQRGFSVVYGKDGKEIIKSSESIAPGDKISLKFYIGIAGCTVDSTDT